VCDSCRWERNGKRIALDIALGLRELHSMGVVHRCAGKLGGRPPLGRDMLLSLTWIGQHVLDLGLRTSACGPHSGGALSEGPEPWAVFSCVAYSLR